MTLGLLVLGRQGEKCDYRGERPGFLFPSLVPFGDLDGSRGELSVGLQSANPSCAATERSPHSSAMRCCCCCCWCFGSNGYASILIAYTQR